MSINVISNFLDPHNAEKLNNLLFNGSNWSFSGRSKEDLEPSFWYYEMYNLEEIKNIFILKVKSYNFKINKINAFYANGQSHGQCGRYHQDSKNAEDLTLLYYANNKWEKNWGGATIFLNKENSSESVYPEFNKAVIFKSNILHAGLEPTSLFRGLRVTVALKFS